MDFECPECQSKTEYEQEPEDVTSTSTFVCPSCQTLYDLTKKSYKNSILDTKTITKSKFDKTNYKNKIAGIENQLDLYGKRGLGSKSYTVPCPHCKHIWEMKGVPIRSVHWCSSCYQYFGINDVKITILSEGKEKQYKHGFQVTPIYSTSIFNHDNMDKLADVWANFNPNPKPTVRP